VLTRPVREDHRVTGLFRFWPSCTGS